MREKNIFTTKKRKKINARQLRVWRTILKQMFHMGRALIYYAVCGVALGKLNNRETCFDPHKNNHARKKIFCKQKKTPYTKNKKTAQGVRSK